MSGEESSVMEGTGRQSEVQGGGGGRVGGTAAEGAGPGMGWGGSGRSRPFLLL